MNRKSYIEKSRVKNSLVRVDHCYSKTKQLEKIASGYINGSLLRDTYRELKSLNLNNISTEILIHSENILKELKMLAGTLGDARSLLQYRVKHDE